MSKINQATIHKAAKPFSLPDTRKELIPWAIALLGLLVMYFPTFRDLFNGLSGRSHLNSDHPQDRLQVVQIPSGGATLALNA